MAFDHFANNGYGIVFHATDLIRALSEGQQIRVLVPNARAFFIVPFLGSVAAALVVGWVIHALIVTLRCRSDRAPDSTLAADYDDTPPVL